MQIQTRASKLLLFMLPALAFGVLEKPTFAQTSTAVKTYKSLGEAKENYRNALLILALKLKPISPEQRLAYFYAVKVDLFDVNANPQAGNPDFDASVLPNGTYASLNTSVLENILVGGDKIFTTEGVKLWIFMQLLPFVGELVNDLNQAFPEATEIPYGRSAKMDAAAQEWAQQWLKKAKAENLTAAYDKAYAFIKSLQPLNIEGRAQALRNAANAASPEAGKAFAQYYDSEKVKEFAANLTKAPQVEQNQPIETIAPIFSQEIFNTSVEKLPSNFLGNDVNLIMKALEKTRVKPKDEFEKTADYTQRLNGSISLTMNMHGDWSKESYFAASCRIDDSDKIYNADTETLKISFPSTFRVASHKYFYNYLNISLENKIKFPHTSTTYEYDPDTIRTITAIDPFTIANMPPEAAKNLKPEVNVLLLFRLLSSKYTKDLPRGSFYGDPQDEYTITPDIGEIWIFNSQTGEIYKKLTAQ